MYFQCFLLTNVASLLQIPTTICRDDYVHEVCRYGGAELHAVAAIVGGCAAQEAIKLITKQCIPVNNLFIYNTMKSESVTLKV